MQERKSYKDILDSQVIHQVVNAQIFGTMTGHEKKMNKGELHEFK